MARSTKPRNDVFDTGAIRLFLSEADGLQRIRGKQPAAAAADVRASEPELFS